MFGCCGIDCSKCECFQATKNGDDLLKHEMAMKWSAIYQDWIHPGQIGCHGCMGDENHLSVFCAGCGIRRCCRSKNLTNCGACPQFPCEKSSALLGDAYAAEKYVNSFR